MIKKELNNKQGERLIECLKEIRMTQKELAEKTNFSQQHINNIVKGNRNMSLDAAKRFSSFFLDITDGRLDVSEDYLLGSTDSKNTFESISKRVKISGGIEHNFEMILSLMGYGRTRSFWVDFDLLSAEEKQRYAKDADGMGYAVAFNAGARLLHEYITPSGKYIYIQDLDFRKFMSELQAYTKFKVEYDFSNSDWTTDGLYDFSDIQSEAVRASYEPTIATDANRAMSEPIHW